jgi:aspartate kinase
MLKVYKFGGASVKDADGVRNVAEIIRRFSAGCSVVAIISAMGKTTNALESVVAEAVQSEGRVTPTLQSVIEYHTKIVDGLFDDSSKSIIYSDLNEIYTSIQSNITSHYSKPYDFFYDQVVSMGEVLSTTIVTAYLTYSGIHATLTDAREIIHADHTYREGQVNWKATSEAVHTYVNNAIDLSEEPLVVITQGFIGRSDEGYTITLGREGSDYSAAIFAHLLKSAELVIWKDVPGVLNADPRYFPDAQLFNHLSYTDTIELSYYGATVIHPKTLKPLQNLHIPLRVKSFVRPDEPGTLIDGEESVNLLPAFIVKQDQALISISPIDFSFIAEENLSKIFGLLARFRIRMNLMQLSALSFDVCVDADHAKLNVFLPELEGAFHVTIKKGLQLITIRNYNERVVSMLIKDRDVLVEQKSSHTIRLVTT